MTLIEQSLRRRSVRKYSGKEVSDQLITRLLEAAGHTQTMGNLQLYSVVVTRDEKMKATLSPLHFGQPMIREAPVVLTVCADFHRTTRWCECREALPGYANFLSFVNAASDALLFTQTFCCLAEEAGLGVCYIGTTVYQPGKIIDALRLPRLVMPIATLTVGWPAEEPPQSDRLPVAAYVHAETYRDYSPADIAAHYAHKESLPENRRFVEINHKETLAQVYAEARYPRRDNEAMSESLLAALRRQGFLP